jgi:hypothetical protein
MPIRRSRRGERASKNGRATTGRVFTLVVDGMTLGQWKRVAFGRKYQRQYTTNHTWAVPYAVARTIILIPNGKYR